MRQGNFARPTLELSMARTIEYPMSGATYNQDKFGVYEYGTYGRSSVLRGQQRRMFLDSFETLAEALKAYPDAEPTSAALDRMVEMRTEG